MRCPQCDSELTQVGQFWICPNHAQVSPGKPFDPLRIFLSYGRDHYARDALHIKADLETRGHEVWFDAEQLREGRDWERSIEEGLKWCEKVVLLMTPHSVRRGHPGDPDSRDGYCLNEIAKAIERNKLIIPVLLVSLEEGPPTSICRIQYLDLRDSVPIDEHRQRYESRLDRLFQALEHNDLDFEGGQARLQRLLRPLDYDLQISPHIARFTGREWLLRELNTWLSAGSDSRIFWIVGKPGVGKSAIAAHLAHSEPHVAAIHFCVYGDDDKSDPRRVVLSLAYQLAQYLPEYQKRLHSQPLEEDFSKNAETLFDRLIVKPMSGDFPAPEHDWLVVLDALDEATRNDRNEIAQFIAQFWPHTPRWLRLVITSRPETAVTSPLQRLSLQPHVVDANSDENRTDIEGYLLGRLRSSGREPDQDLLKKLVEKTEGIFLYAQVIADEIDAGRLSLDRMDLFPSGLGDYYRRFFERQFADQREFSSEMIPFLSCLVAQREPVPWPLLLRATGLSEFVIRQKCLASLGSLVSVRGMGREADSSQSISFFHKSLPEWLTGVDEQSGTYTAGRFAVDKSSGHGLLAKACLEVYQDASINAPPYVLRHALQHAVEAADWSGVDRLLRDNELSNLRIADRGLAAAVVELASAIETLFAAAPGGNADSSVNRCAYVTPVLPQLCLRMEENVTGTFGAASAECRPVAQILRTVSATQICELFESVASRLDRSPHISDDPVLRAILCASQLFFEAELHAKSDEVASEAARRHPTCFKALHFAAIAASYAGLAAKEQREQHLQRAIDMERQAQNLPGAQWDSYFGVSYSTIGKQQIRLAKHFLASGQTGLVDGLLNNAVENIHQRLNYGSSLIAWTYLAEAKAMQGQLREAYNLVKAITSKDWFAGGAQALALELASRQPFDFTFEPTLYRHLRHWVLASGSVFDSDYADFDHQRKLDERFLQFLFEEGLEPEAELRYPKMATAHRSGIAAECALAKRETRRVVIRIGNSVLDCRVQVWEFSTDRPHTVVGLPSISLFGSGPNFQQAAEYLRELLVSLNSAIRNGEWSHLRSTELQQVARWIEEHQRLGTAPPERVANTLKRAEEAYRSGAYPAARRLLDDLEVDRDLFDISQLHVYLRYRAWVAARCGEADPIRYLFELSRLCPTYPLIITDYLACLITCTLVPNRDAIDCWRSLGRELFGETASSDGSSVLFWEYSAAAALSAGEVEEAENLLRKALAQEQGGLGELRIISRIQARLAEALRRLGNFDEAQSLLAAARDAQRDGQWTGDLAELTLTNWAKLHTSSTVALEFLREAQAIEETNESILGLARTLAVTARISQDTAEIRSIQRRLDTLFQISPGLQSCPGLARILTEWDDWAGQGPDPRQDFWGI